MEPERADEIAFDFNSVQHSVHGSHWDFERDECRMNARQKSGFPVCLRYCQQFDGVAEFCCVSEIFGLDRTDAFTVNYIY